VAPAAANQLRYVAAGQTIGCAADRLLLASPVVVGKGADFSDNTYMNSTIPIDFQGIFPPLDQLSPAEFETLVKSWFEKLGDALESFEVAHLETLAGSDGEYTFDVTVRFKAFQGAAFLVLVECKKHKNPVKREVIQVLHDRLRSVGGHKGFVVATTSFQSGAVEYAQQHGIALVQVVGGHVMYIRASADANHLPLPPNTPRFVGCHFSPMSNGRVAIAFIGPRDSSVLESLLASPSVIVRSKD
jgi:restriction system protein